MTATPAGTSTALAKRDPWSVGFTSDAPRGISEWRKTDDKAPYELAYELDGGLGYAFNDGVGAQFRLLCRGPGMPEAFRSFVPQDLRSQLEAQTGTVNPITEFSRATMASGIRGIFDSVVGPRLCNGQLASPMRWAHNTSFNEPNWGAFGSPNFMKSSLLPSFAAPSMLGGSLFNGFPGDDLFSIGAPRLTRQPTFTSPMNHPRLSEADLKTMVETKARYMAQNMIRSLLDDDGFKSFLASMVNPSANPSSKTPVAVPESWASDMTDNFTARLGANQRKKFLTSTHPDLPPLNARVTELSEASDATTTTGKSSTIPGAISEATESTVADTRRLTGPTSMQMVPYTKPTTLPMDRISTNQSMVGPVGA